MRLYVFCPINYQIDKEAHHRNFFKHFAHSHHHQGKTGGIKIGFWRKFFDHGPLVQQVEKDLNLVGLNNKPRYSWQAKNTRLRPHVDESRIIGINFNLKDEPAIIHIDGVPYPYECALIDVGTQLHSVEPAPYTRLVLKFALREPWDVVYGRLKEKGLLANSDQDKYVSVLTDENKQRVRM